MKVLKDPSMSEIFDQALTR